LSAREILVRRAAEAAVRREAAEAWDRARAEPLKAPPGAFPIVRQAVAELREIFGPGIRLTWASEAGMEIGTRGPAGVPMSLAHNPKKKKRAYR
jgi:hypothetical protein